MTARYTILLGRVLAENRVWRDEHWSDPVNRMPLSGDMQIFYDIRNVCTPAAIVALAFCGIRWIMATDPRTADVAKKWFVAILSGVALFWLVPGVVLSITNGTGG